MINKAFRFARYLLRRALFPVFERIVPADDNCWCFCTWDRHWHTLDSPRAVLEALSADPSITAVVLQKVRSSSGEDRNTPGVRFVKAESLRGAWHLARSRVVLIAYGMRGLSSYATGLTRKHIIIQLWHGIPLRRIGRLFPRETWWADETPKYSAMVASSEKERDHLSQAFAPVPREEIWLTGLPRNDFFLGDETALPADYRDHLDGLRKQLAGRRLVLYAPTWRDREEDHYQFSPEESQRLSEVLRRHKTVLGVRGHSNVRHLSRYTTDSDVAEIITMNHIPDVNVVMRETAVLVTDYSSIYLDFVLTGRPILHFTYDFDTYLKNRIGFFYEVDEAFAGPRLHDFDQFLEHLDRALGSGVEDAPQYRHVRDLFHTHPAGSGPAVAGRIKDLVRRKNGR
jgi:CDP-glycerol glycerophosphotransferase (TagB/SpsB family)